MLMVQFVPKLFVKPLLIVDICPLQEVAIPDVKIFVFNDENPFVAMIIFVVEADFAVIEKTGVASGPDS